MPDRDMPDRDMPDRDGPDRDMPDRDMVARDMLARDVLDALGWAGDIASVRPLAGGCVADAWLVAHADGRHVVAKTLAGAGDDLFPIEAEGLSVLRRTGGLLTPDVLAVTPRLLILQALSPLTATGPDQTPTEPGWTPTEPGWTPTEPDWPAFARSVAAMHRGTEHDRSGWPRDGYLGRLRQVNTWTADGHEFFAEHRLLRYLREPGVAATLSADDRRALERLCDRLPDIVPPMPAVLIHGDLWSGNLLTKADGKIAVIDPAVCYAWAEIDLSMLWCNVRPDQSGLFFDLYQELNPSPPGWQERMPLLNLRELLSTLAHFGTAAAQTARLVRDTLAPFR